MVVQRVCQAVGLPAGATPRCLPHSEWTAAVIGDGQGAQGSSHMRGLLPSAGATLLYVHALKRCNQ
jgi:hypothetical protein